MKYALAILLSLCFLVEKGHAVAVETCTDFAGSAKVTILERNGFYDENDLLNYLHQDFQNLSEQMLSQYMYAASSSGWLKVVTFLLLKKIDVNILYVQPNLSITPLGIAAWCERTDIVKLLLKNHANPNAKISMFSGIYNKRIETDVLHLAAVGEGNEGGDVDIISELKNNGVHLGARDSMGYTAQRLACELNEGSNACRILSLR